MAKGKGREGTGNEWSECGGITESIVCATSEAYDQRWIVFQGTWFVHQSPGDLKTIEE